MIDSKSLCLKSMPSISKCLEDDPGFSEAGMSPDDVMNRLGIVLKS